MHETASNAFYSTEISLQNLVYGDPSETKKQKQDETNIFKDDIKAEEDENDNLFDFVKKIASKRKKHIEKAIDEEDINAEDCTVTQMEPSDLTTDWDDPEVRETIRNKFVTGDWSSRRDAAEHGAAKDDQENHMNDSEASDKEEADEDNIEVDYGEDNENDPESIRKKREEKKKSFDQTFDKLKDGNASDDEDENPDDPLTVEKWRRKQLEDDPQTILNKTEFQGLNKQLREQIEGFSPGTYVRIEFVDFPPEFIENVDFHNPILVGGMHQEECRMGYIKIRLKRHRWFPKTLKNKDPLIFSIGWRRFQSIPTYCMQDVNGRHRMIKYTPEYMHCIAAIYGPYTPQNTGVIAFQTLSNKVDTFRVAATGYVMEIDQSFQIVKKLKLIGYPKKIYKNTAFITGMFSSSLEIAKYEGAALRTVSGIRGQVKKASKQGQEGEFRATFEDKILMSDIVFLRVWYQLELEKFYNPVLNHLTKKWYAMRTVYQLRKLRGESIPVNKDSQYRPVEERSVVGHDQTFIPKPNLLKKLPFSAQNKKVVDSTGLTDDLKKYLSANAPLHDLTTALMSDKEILRANMLRKMQAIDADRRKKQQKLQAKFQLKMKTKEVREERLRNRKKSATQKRKYIEQEMRRIKKAKYYSGDNEQK
jgi:ribosome biogenesis protein BMS1